jgi:hypothetical protein
VTTENRVLRQSPARCGTPSGYNRHKREGERPCNACYKAEVERQARWRNASEDRIRGGRLRARAQSRAQTALRRLHPDEYRKLYAAAVVELMAEQGIVRGGRKA